MLFEISFATEQTKLLTIKRNILQYNIILNLEYFKRETTTWKIVNDLTLHRSLFGTLSFRKYYPLPGIIILGIF